jgi:DNA adenine methylase
MKTPITYYGGKQNLVSTILKMIPKHQLYCEPFLGGGAVFFAKERSDIEVINDLNKEVINFYKVVQNDFISLEKLIRITLHSRTQHSDASVMYNHPHLFSEIQRAWAVWTLASQSFGSIIDSSWGYDRSKNTTTKKISNKRASFTEDYAIRLQNVQIENTDALRIIISRDQKNAFFYCDPPYFNSDMGHYGGYTERDFTDLLTRLSKVEGKFLLSSYPSPVLNDFTKKYRWHKVTREMRVSVGLDRGRKPVKRKPKTEVLTANFPIEI